MEGVKLSKTDSGLENNSDNCPNCGASVTTEICPYCHAMTGLISNEKNTEFPIIESENIEKTLNNDLPGFIIMTVAFGVMAVITLFSFQKSISILFAIIFGIVSVVTLCNAIIIIINFLLLKIKGQNIEATVYGYSDDIYENSVKLLINTDEGLRFIFLQLDSRKRSYKISGKINLRRYKNKFLILDNTKYVF